MNVDEFKKAIDVILNDFNVIKIFSSDQMLHFFTTNNTVIRLPVPGIFFYSTKAGRTVLTYGGNSEPYISSIGSDGKKIEQLEKDKL